MNIFFKSHFHKKLYDKIKNNSLLWNNFLVQHPMFKKYLEHRMAAWHSLVLLESDIAFDTIAIINSREIFNLAMSIPKEVRIKNELINAIINMNCPSLLDIPIN